MNSLFEAVKDLLSGEKTAVKHLDETGFRVAGRTRWIHMLCSPCLNHLRSGVTRGNVSENLSGKVVHDCFSSNWTEKGVTHGVCNAHTLREVQALIAIEKKPWASDMKTIQLDALDLTIVAQSQDQGAVSPEAIKDIERRFDICCEKAVTFRENQLPLTHTSKGKKRGRPVECHATMTPLRWKTSSKFNPLWL